MSPSLMRKLWTLIESTQTATLLQFNDADLVQWLLRQLRDQQPIDAQTTSYLDRYIQSKLPLIRDTAEGRNSV